VLSRFLRNRIHHRAALGAGSRQAWDRSRLVWRLDLRKHPDELYASAVRLCAVLPARHCAALGEKQRHLLGCDPLGLAPGDPGRHHHLLARLGHLLDQQDRARRPDKKPQHRAADRPAAATTAAMSDGPQLTLRWSRAEARLLRSCMISSEKPVSTF